MDSANQEELVALRKQNIGRLFQRAARGYSELALEKLRAMGRYDGLTIFHTTLIANLDIEGTRISLLAERAGISKQAMGQLVDELEKDRFIRREVDPSDKRAALIKFTDKGWQFLQDAYQVKVEIEAAYVAILGEEQFAMLRTLLETLITHKP
jgi:DNA-binding MarR family transcriptional regulator